MSLTTQLRKAAYAFPIVFAIAANANAAELGCYTNKADIEGLKDQVFGNEGMQPVTSHYRNAGNDKSPKWVMNTLLMNTRKGTGYEWSKQSETVVCLSKSYSNIELYNNASLDLSVMLDKGAAPFANNTGTKGDLSSVGINALLLAEENSGRFPMYRAKVEKILAQPEKLPSNYYEYLVANPKTGEGSRISANLNGKVIPEYTFSIGAPPKDSVPNGAIYSATAKKILTGQTASIAGGSTSLALAK